MVAFLFLNDDESADTDDALAADEDDAPLAAPPPPERPSHPSGAETRLLRPAKMPSEDLPAIERAGGPLAGVKAAFPAVC